MKPLFEMDDFLFDDMWHGDAQKAASIANEKIREMATCPMGGLHEVDTKTVGYDGIKILGTCHWCHRTLTLIASED